jgi:hypothetical protein
VKPIKPLYWRARVIGQTLRDERANEWKDIAKVWAFLFAIGVVAAILAGYLVLPHGIPFMVFLNTVGYVIGFFGTVFVPLATISTFFVWLSNRR